MRCTCLQCNHSFDEVAACCPAGAKLTRLLKARPLSTLVTSTGVNNQRELLLVALVSVGGLRKSCLLAAC